MVDPWWTSHMGIRKLASTSACTNIAFLSPVWVKENLRFFCLCFRRLWWTSTMGIRKLTYTNIAFQALLESDLFVCVLDGHGGHLADWRDSHLQLQLHAGAAVRHRVHGIPRGHLLHGAHAADRQVGRKEGHVLFNDALDTFFTSDLIDFTCFCFWHLIQMRANEWVDLSSSTTKTAWGRKVMFYLTTHSTHFLFTVIWHQIYG